MSVRSCICLGALTLVVFLVSCSSSSSPDPCEGKGSYTGAELCAKLETAVVPKCGSFDKAECARCNEKSTFCVPGADATLKQIDQAADCSGAKRVTIYYACS